MAWVDCNDNTSKLHEWIALVIAPASAAFVRKNLVHSGPVNKEEIRAAVHQVLIDNVRTHGLPPPLLAELVNHTKRELEEK